MESQPQNPEFRNHPENFHPWDCLKRQKPSSDTKSSANYIEQKNLKSCFFRRLKHFCLVQYRSPSYFTELAILNIGHNYPVSSPEPSSLYIHYN